MIRYSKESDIDGIINLWKEAFGDSEKEITFFLDNRYKAENTLIAEENGKVASMLFLLDGEMKVDDKIYLSYYLYAACTLKEFRGRGYMASLLDFARETAINRNIDFICLLPAEESLYQYYENHGYKAVFRKKTYEINRNNNNASLIDYESFCDFEKSRNDAFADIDYFKWDSSGVDFAVEHHKFYGGQVVSNCEGFLLYSVSDRELHVKENTFTDNLCNVFSDLFNLYPNVDKIIADLPSGIKFAAENYKEISWGMALAVNKQAEFVLDKIKNAYLGLTLN